LTKEKKLFFTFHNLIKFFFGLFYDDKTIKKGSVKK